MAEISVQILSTAHIWLLNMLAMHCVFLACPGFLFWVIGLRNLWRGLMLNEPLKDWCILTLAVGKEKKLERQIQAISSFFQKQRSVAMKFVTILLSIKNFNVLMLQSAPASGNYFECLNYPSSIKYNNLCAIIFALYSVQNTSSTQRYILGIEVNVCTSQR